MRPPLPHGDRPLTETRRSGISILELMITIAVGTVILGGVFSMIFVSQTSFAENLTMSKVEYSAKLSLLKIENEVMDSSVESPNWSLADGTSAATLTFNRCTGTLDGEKVWGPSIQFLRNGDRLIRQDFGGAQTVLSDDIQALTFTLNGNVLNVAIAASGNHRDRFVYSTTAQLDIELRN